jgi:hypothetical protein
MARRGTRMRRRWSGRTYSADFEAEFLADLRTKRQPRSNKHIEDRLYARKTHTKRDDLGAQRIISLQLKPTGPVKPSGPHHFLILSESVHDPRRPYLLNPICLGPGMDRFGSDVKSARLLATKSPSAMDGVAGSSNHQRWLNARLTNASGVVPTKARKSAIRWAWS